MRRTAWGVGDGWWHLLLWTRMLPESNGRVGIREAPPPLRTPNRPGERRPFELQVWHSAPGRCKVAGDKTAAQSVADRSDVCQSPGRKLPASRAGAPPSDGSA